MRYLEYKFIRTESRMTVVRSWGKQKGALVFNGARFPFGKMRKFLKMGSGDGRTTMRIYIMPQNSTLNG